MRLIRSLAVAALLVAAPACTGDADSGGPGTNPTATDTAPAGATPSANADAAPAPAPTIGEDAAPSPAAGDAGATPTPPTGGADAAPTPAADPDATQGAAGQDATPSAAGADAAPAPAGTTAEVGQPAPAFTLTDLEGNVVSLADFKNKTVVLEWFNPDCPYVRHAHTEGPLKGLAGKQRGIVWLTINSGAPGKQGAGKARNVQAADDYGIKNPILLDEDGRVGRLYGAQTTPHMYVIDRQGVLVYRGAIDNAPLGRVQEGAEPVNYVTQAIADLTAKQPVRISDTRAYGCSVKYPD